MDIYTYFFFAYFVIFLLISFNLIILQKLTSYKIYGFLCLLMAYASFLNFLMFSNRLINFPFLFRTSSPLHYLYGPLNYFFVIYTLNSKRSWSKEDYLHLLPFILNFLELSPLFFSSTEVKVEMLKNFNSSTIMAYDLGLLDTRKHLLLKNTFYLLYCFFSLKLLFPVWNNRQSALFLKNRTLFSWIFFDSIAKAFVIITTIVLLFLEDYLNDFFKQLLNIFFGLEMILSIVYILYNPKILLGVQWVDIESIRNLDLQLDKKNLKKEKEEKVLLQELNEFMALNEAYKKKITVNDIAVSLKISPKKLATLINENYSQSFTDYINDLRLKCIDKQVLENKHLRYSFEHIAYDAGFSSKNAFYVAFKKLRNSTPKKFYNIID
jgi:AraC-like DNA-binding protein